MDASILVFLIPVAAIAALIAGIVLIAKRRTKPWYLWTGIALILVFVLTLPLSFPIGALGLLLLTGGSFGA